MIVAIHQPNFFPWLGYFDKMKQADLFILLDTVPFTKGGYQNRAQIKSSQGAQWLTLPVVTKGRLGQITLDVEIEPLSTWRKDHQKTIESLYRKSPHFEAVYSGLCSLYQSNCEKLVAFNAPSIEWIKRMLDIKTPLILASEMGVEGSGSELLLKLTQKAGGTAYLSGPSGRNYLDQSLFEKAGVELRFHSFKPFPYPQRYGDFIPGLSALDYLFNAGAGAWGVSA